MPSWQARTVTWTLKRLTKTRTADEKIENTRRLIRWVERIPRRRTGIALRPAVVTGGVVPVAAEWVEPIGVNPRRTLVYLHGGAYFFCSPRTHRPIAAFLARHIPARVLLPDYRLAPEHPFPAAVEDALACVGWVLAQGTEARDLALAGDYAGGGLALAVLIALRDAGRALPAAAACISPWTDLTASGASITTNSESDAWVYGETVKLGARGYLAGADPTHPLASPLHADLKGLPPLLLHVSDSEVLLDDSVRLAEKARAAGVSAQCKIWPGLPHVWQGFVPFIPEAAQSLGEISGFLRGT
jgi:acetyl esterase/lipase